MENQNEIFGDWFEEQLQYPESEPSTISSSRGSSPSFCESSSDEESTENEEAEKHDSTFSDSGSDSSDEMSELEDENDTRFLRRRGLIKLWMYAEEDFNLAAFMRRIDKDWYDRIRRRFKNEEHADWFETIDAPWKIPLEVRVYMRLIHYGEKRELDENERRLVYKPYE